MRGESDVSIPQVWNLLPSSFWEWNTSLNNGTNNGNGASCVTSLPIRGEADHFVPLVSNVPWFAVHFFSSFISFGCCCSCVILILVFKYFIQSHWFYIFYLIYFFTMDFSFIPFFIYRCIFGKYWRFFLLLFPSCCWCTLNFY